LDRQLLAASFARAFTFFAHVSLQHATAHAIPALRGQPAAMLAVLGLIGLPVREGDRQPVLPTPASWAHTAVTRPSSAQADPHLTPSHIDGTEHENRKAGAEIRSISDVRDHHV
jgi:hypothetical protein